MISGAPPYRLSRLGVARTFQNLRLFARPDRPGERAGRARPHPHPVELAVRRWWPVASGGRTAPCSGRADALLDRFGLTEFADGCPGSLPYGIQRRRRDRPRDGRAPRLLLLDEPAAGLNGEEVRQLGEIVRSIRDSGITVVLIEHNMGLVMSLCERVTVLAERQRHRRGHAGRGGRHPAVIEAYLGDSGWPRRELPARRTRMADAMTRLGFGDTRRRAVAPRAGRQDLTVHYGGVCAVRRSASPSRPGQAVGIIGANGAGKTSTLKALMGLVPRSGGAVRFGDADLTQVHGPRHGPARHRLRARGPARLRRPAGREEPAARRVRPPLERRRPATALAEVYELFPVLGEMRGRLAGALSGGQQQMLAIGRALMSRPRCCCSTSRRWACRRSSSRTSWRSLRRLRDDGLSLLLVEQNAKLTFEATSDCLVVENGELP